MPIQNIICKLDVRSPLDILYESYHDHLLDESSSALRFLLNIPGFLALKSPLEIATLARCFCMELTTLTSLIKRSLPFLVFARDNFAIMIVPTLVEFLKKSSRSASYYQDYQQHEIVHLRQCLSYTLTGDGPYLEPGLITQFFDISIAALENNIDTFIILLRKFILEETTKRSISQVHRNYAFWSVINTILRRIERTVSTVSSLSNVTSNKVTSFVTRFKHMPQPLQGFVKKFCICLTMPYPRLWFIHASLPLV